MKSSMIIILCIYLLKEGFEYAVLFLNLRYMKRFGSVIPPEFEGHLDEELLKKTQAYEMDRARLGVASSLFGNLVMILFIFGGLLDIYNSWIASLGLSFAISGWLFFLLLTYADEIIFIPFSLYGTFRLENRYGFNAMTPALWISDFVKSLVISTVMLSIVIFAALRLIQWSPDYWWFWVWSFLFSYSIFVMYISPYVIEPLFNKFTTLDDEGLKEKITDLTDKVGIHLSRVLKIDASKRSKHTNAYFTGIGRTKRIVLYDTLMESMNHSEILAVIAHEIGHWKRRHLLKMLAAFEISSLASLYISYRLVQDDLLLRMFNISTETIYAKFVILGFIAGIVILPLQPLMNFFVRKHEREADRASFDLTEDSGSMVSALVKLSKENLSNLHPHPLYVTLYYSHPPIVDRVRYIKEFGR